MEQSGREFGNSGEAPGGTWTVARTYRSAELLYRFSTEFNVFLRLEQR